MAPLAFIWLILALNVLVAAAAYRRAWLRAWKEGERAAEERFAALEREREQALAVLADDEDDCPYVKETNPNNFPCGHGGVKDSKIFVRGCGVASRAPGCRYPQGDHVHCTCSLCQYEWIRVIR